VKKTDAIKMLRVLSALESWAFAHKCTLPDYLHDQLQDGLGVLENELMEPEKTNESDR
jgi:hypothetical protein